MKIINCIYSKNKLDFKKYIKIAKADDVISYHDVITKLLKGDGKIDKPSDFVISSYIRKKIIKAITDKNTKTIVYAIKNLDIDTIKCIKTLINDYYSENIVFNLIVIKNKRLVIHLNDEFITEFNSVKYYEL